MTRAMVRHLAVGGAVLAALAPVPDALAARPQEPAAPSPGAADAPTGPRERLQEAIRNRLEATAGLPGRLEADGAAVRTEESLSAFYEERGYEPAWIDGAGLRPAARALVDELARAPADGLETSDYHLARIRELTASLPAAVTDGDAGAERGGDDGSAHRWRLRWRPRFGSSGRPPAASPDDDAPPRVDPGRLVDLELLLTDAALLFASHLAAGHVDPSTLHADWLAETRERDPVAALREALARDAPDAVPRLLDDLRPDHAGYRALKEALAAYRSRVAAGGWPSVPEGPTLRPGDRSQRVPALRARLAAGPGAAGDSPVYDDGLAAAVRDFQRRHGLEPDAVVGANTLRALNVPASERVRQIVVNLERWRWLPQDLGDRYVMVNAADYRLDVVEDADTVLTMRAVVGRPYRQTPVFSDRITYLVFNPYWHVPHNLAVQDQLPLQKSDPGHFDRVGMRVFRGWGADAEAVDPASVDWSQVTAGSFPYRLRQDPGPHNALGRVKFMFPNRFSVYLHDTPTRDLFAKTVRSFSSGCIRVEKAGELARHLLREAPGWTPERVASAMEGGGAGAPEETARLPSPVPVHLLYWTAWAGADGGVQFRPDVYGRDGPVARALEAPPPVPGSPGGAP